MESTDALRALSALAQESRLAVFQRLIGAGPDGENAGAIAAALDIPSPTLSFHLKELGHAGLIAQRRAGRSIIYAARYERMRALLSFLMKDCCGGNPQICNFDFKELCNDQAACASTRS